MEKVYYYNRNGMLQLTFGEAPYYMRLGTGKFKDQSWAYDNQFGLMKSFRRDQSSYPFSVVITSNDPADYDKLCDIFNDDIIANSPGYFLINGWKLSCYVVKAEHEFYGWKDHVIAFEAISENSTWIRTNTRVFSGESSGLVENDYGRDYTLENSVLGRGYNYGYSLTSTHIAVVDLPGSENGYEVTFYGPIVNPIIYINNHPIKVLIEVDSGERLRITSNGSEKTIKLLSQSGQETDAFIYRDKENSPFVSLGSYSEITFGEIRFDFTTIERRSEPTWT